MPDLGAIRHKIHVKVEAAQQGLLTAKVRIQKSFEYE